MCAVMFPFGIAMPKDGAADRQWGWFPQGKDKDYPLLYTRMSQIMTMAGRSAEAQEWAEAQAQ